MFGFEFIVVQELVEIGFGVGIGVWVINKQICCKRREGEEDEIVVYLVYYIVGEYIYMVFSFVDIMSV